jgi:hypothetical protein
MAFLNPNDPFFRSPVVRWVSVLIPLGWAAVELWLEEPFWAILFGALGVYAGWVLIVKGPDKPDGGT